MYQVQVDSIPYHTTRSVGRGSFGRVLLLQRTQDNDDKASRAFGMGKHDLCIKIPDSRENSSIKQLRYEMQVYRHLQGSLQGTIIPLCFGMSTAVDTKTHQQMPSLVLEHIHGETLEAIKKQHGRVPPRIVMALAIRLLESLQQFHARGIVHRDLKPSNIIITKNSRVVVLDFGLVKAVLDENNRHIKQRKKRGLTGTPRFASCHSHEGSEVSYRDDCESVMYTLLYLYQDRLPWQELTVPGSKDLSKKSRARRRNRLIYEKKTAMDVQALFGHELSVLARILLESRSLSFGSMPPYENWIAACNDAFTRR